MDHLQQHETFEIYSFACTLHFYVFLLEMFLHMNPFHIVIYSTFAYTLSYYFFNYSLTSFFFHPMWRRKLYQVALPQLINAFQNILILKGDYSFMYASVLSLGVYTTVQYNFFHIESSQSSNIRAILTMITMMIRYMILLLL